MRRHIVWDWNGTLMNDAGAAWQALARTVTDFGGQSPTRDDYRRYVDAAGLPDYYQRLIGVPVTDALWAEIDKTWMGHFTGLVATCTLAVTAAPALEQWEEWGRSQSVLTLHYRDHVTEQCTRHGIHDRFIRIDGRLAATPDLGWKGPPLAAHLNDLDMPASNVVVIGDTVADARAAEHVGATCILYADGVNHPDRLAATGYPVVDCFLEAITIAATLP